MAFPTSPDDGDQYTTALGVTYEYDATGDKWQIVSGEILVEDDGYGVGWDGDTDHAPSQNAVYDKINSLETTLVEDDAFGAGWNGDTTHAPSQNAVYDEVNQKCEMVEGQYTGSGSKQNITGLGWEPDLVIICNDVGYGWIKIENMGQWDAYQLAAGAYRGNAIDLISDGFSVGNDANDYANRSGEEYFYSAFKA